VRSMNSRGMCVLNIGRPITSIDTYIIQAFVSKTSRYSAPSSPSVALFVTSTCAAFSALPSPLL
jgi:hypothetical protein